MRFITALLLSLLLAGCGARGAPDTTPAPSPRAIALDVSPRFGTAPVMLRLKITIPLDPAARQACVGYAGPNYAQSCWSLVGATRQTSWKYFRGLPGGRYVAFLEVRWQGEGNRLVRVPFCVIGGRGSQESCS